MKKIIIILLLFMFTTRVRALPRRDYMLHFSAGWMTSVTIARWQYRLGTDDDYGIWTLGIPVFLGISKEFYDSPDLKWNKENWKDLGYTVLGAITGKLMSYTF